MHRLILLLVWLLVCGTFHARTVSDSLLRELDITIDRNEDYSAERRRKIDVVRARIPAIDNDSDRYKAMRQLYGAYRSYRNDSAVYVAAERLDIARRLGDSDKTASASLNLAESFSAVGNYHEALGILDTLNRCKLQDYHLHYLYSVYARTYLHLANDETLEHKRGIFLKKLNQYRDSSLQLRQPTEAAYHYLKAWMLIDAGHYGDALSVMNSAADRFGPPDGDASALTQLAVVYGRLERPRQEMECLARAALLDLRDGRKDYTALPDLALLLYRNGDAERAYRYIRRALDDASFCSVKSQTLQVLKAVPLIDAAYHESEERNIHILVAGISVAALLTVALCVALKTARSRQKAARRLAAELDEKNRLLQESNRRLAEANGLRSGFINTLFDSHSGYVKQTGEFRRSLSRMMAAGNYAKVLDTLKSDRIEADEIKKLYQRFDAMFLAMHPHFIGNFNSRVAPPDRIDHDSTALTSALRVLALMKTGITSTSSIASMLRYTPQTVYNYKNRLRSMLGNVDIDSPEFLNSL